MASHRRRDSSRQRNLLHWVFRANSALDTSMLSSPYDIPDLGNKVFFQFASLTVTMLRNKRFGLQ